VQRSSTKRLTIGICVALASGIALFAAPGAQARSPRMTAHAGGVRVISAARGGRVTIRRDVQLVIRAHVLTHDGKVKVSRLRRHGGYQVSIDVPWHGTLFIATRRRGSHGVVLTTLGGLWFPQQTARSSARSASLLSWAAGSVCLKLGADGAVIIDGEFVAYCLLLKADKDLLKADAARIAGELGHDCVAAVLGASTPTIPATIFRAPACNEPPSARGPTDGSPTIVATLTPGPLNGIPLTPQQGPTVPLTTPSPPEPAPSSPPPTPSGPIFTVMNTSETPPDGVWFRWAPYTADTDRVTGHGVYTNEQVQLACYGWGEAIGPYANRAWYQVLNVSRRTNAGVSNSGWLNAHYVNDGLLANQIDAGVPAC
jgi:hypothetical protein